MPDGLWKFLYVVFIYLLQKSEAGVIPEYTELPAENGMFDPRDDTEIALPENCIQVCDHIGCLIFCPQLPHDDVSQVKRSIFEPRLSRRICCTSNGPITPIINLPPRSLYPTGGDPTPPGPEIPKRLPLVRKNSNLLLEPRLKNLTQSMIRLKNLHRDIIGRRTTKCKTQEIISCQQKPKHNKIINNHNGATINTTTKNCVQENVLRDNGPARGIHKNPYPESGNILPEEKTKVVYLPNFEETSEKYAPEASFESEKTKTDSEINFEQSINNEPLNFVVQDKIQETNDHHLVNKLSSDEDFDQDKLFGHSSSESTLSKVATPKIDAMTSELSVSRTLFSDDLTENPKINSDETFETFKNMKPSNFYVQDVTYESTDDHFTNPTMSIENLHEEKLLKKITMNNSTDSEMNGLSLEKAFEPNLEDTTRNFGTESTSVEYSTEKVTLELKGDSLYDDSTKGADLYQNSLKSPEKVDLSFPLEPQIDNRNKEGSNCVKTTQGTYKNFDTEIPISSFRSDVPVLPSYNEKRKNSQDFIKDNSNIFNPTKSLVDNLRSHFTSENKNADILKENQLDIASKVDFTTPSPLLVRYPSTIQDFSEYQMKNSEIQIPVDHFTNPKNLKDETVPENSPSSLFVDNLVPYYRRVPTEKTEELSTESNTVSLTKSEEIKYNLNDQNADFENWHFEEYKPNREDLLQPLSRTLESENDLNNFKLNSERQNIQEIQTTEKIIATRINRDHDAEISLQKSPPMVISQLPNGGNTFSHQLLQETTESPQEILFSDSHRIKHDENLAGINSAEFGELLEEINSEISSKNLQSVSLSSNDINKVTLSSINLHPRETFGTPSNLDEVKSAEFGELLEKINSEISSKNLQSVSLSSNDINKVTLSSINLHPRETFGTPSNLDEVKSAELGKILDKTNSKSSGESTQSSFIFTDINRGNLLTTVARDSHETSDVTEKLDDMHSAEFGEFLDKINFEIHGENAQNTFVSAVHNSHETSDASLKLGENLETRETPPMSDSFSSEISQKLKSTLSNTNLSYVTPTIGSSSIHTVEYVGNKLSDINHGRKENNEFFTQIGEVLDKIDSETQGEKTQRTISPIDLNAEFPSTVALSFHKPNDVATKLEETYQTTSIRIPVVETESALVFRDKFKGENLLYSREISDVAGKLDKNPNLEVTRNGIPPGTESPLFPHEISIRENLPKTNSQINHKILKVAENFDGINSAEFEEIIDKINSEIHDDNFDQQNPLEKQKTFENVQVTTETSFLSDNDLNGANSFSTNPIDAHEITNLPNEAKTNIDSSRPFEMNRGELDEFLAKINSKIHNDNFDQQNPLEKQKTFENVQVTTETSFLFHNYSNGANSFSTNAIDAHEITNLPNEAKTNIDDLRPFEMNSGELDEFLAKINSEIHDDYFEQNHDNEKQVKNGLGQEKRQINEEIPQISSKQIALTTTESALVSHNDNFNRVYSHKTIKQPKKIESNLYQLSPFEITSAELGEFLDKIDSELHYDNLKGDFNYKYIPDQENKQLRVNTITNPKDQNNLSSMKTNKSSKSLINFSLNTDMSERTSENPRKPEHYQINTTIPALNSQNTNEGTTEVSSSEITEILREIEKHISKENLETAYALPEMTVPSHVVDNSRGTSFGTDTRNNIFEVNNKTKPYRTRARFETGNGSVPLDNSNIKQTTNIDRPAAGAKQSTLVRATDAESSLENGQHQMEHVQLKGQKFVPNYLYESKTNPYYLERKTVNFWTEIPEKLSSLSQESTSTETVLTTQNINTPIPNLITLIDSKESLSSKNEDSLSENHYSTEEYKEIIFSDMHTTTKRSLPSNSSVENTLNENHFETASINNFSDQKPLDHINNRSSSEYLYLSTEDEKTLSKNLKNTIFTPFRDIEIEDESTFRTILDEGQEPSTKTYFREMLLGTKSPTIIEVNDENFEPSTNLGYTVDQKSEIVSTPNYNSKHNFSLTWKTTNKLENHSSSRYNNSLTMENDSLSPNFPVGSQEIDNTFKNVHNREENIEHQNLLSGPQNLEINPQNENFQPNNNFMIVNETTPFSNNLDTTTVSGFQNTKETLYFEKVNNLFDKQKIETLSDPSFENIESILSKALMSTNDGPKTNGDDADAVHTVIPDDFTERVYTSREKQISLLSNYLNNIRPDFIVANLKRDVNEKPDVIDLVQDLSASKSRGNLRNSNLNLCKDSCPCQNDKKIQIVHPSPIYIYIMGNTSQVKISRTPLAEIQGNNEIPSDPQIVVRHIRSTSSDPYEFVDGQYIKVKNPDIYPQTQIPDYEERAALETSRSTSVERETEKISNFDMKKIPTYSYKPFSKYLIDLLKIHTIAPRNMP